MQITAKNNGQHPALHPTLVALSIVLAQNGDLSSINRSHPDLNKHEFYDKRVVFPSDLSDLLPQVADRWWEPLGELYLLICPHAYNFTLQKVKTAEAAHREHAAKTSPIKAPAPVSHRVMLILPEQPPRSEEAALMVVDEELGVTVSAAITGLVLICFY